MGKNDWAIVVGIDTYFDPNLPSLKGPANDAQAFYDWVTSPEGGAVPAGKGSEKKQAFLIQSSEFHPPFASLQNVGLLFHVSIPGAGTVLLDVGRVVIRRGQGIVFAAGPHQELSGDTAAFCAALS